MTQHTISYIVTYRIRIIIHNIIILNLESLLLCVYFRRIYHPILAKLWGFCISWTMWIEKLTQP